MSLVRKPSKNTLRLTPDDLSTCLDQKNGIISVLQCEIEELRSNQEKYDRIKEELMRAKNRYETLLRDHETNTLNNQERLELSARNVYELKAQLDHLESECKIRTQCLKETKFGTQQLLEQQSRKQDEVGQIKIKYQQQKSLLDVRKMEEERTKLQNLQLREEVEKQKRQNVAIRNQTDSVIQKCHKTQNYIRNLLREESNINENLMRVQDENKQLDSTASQLDTIISVNNSEISNIQKNCQECHFIIANKELEKKKFENQTKEKIKILSAEKQKWKSLCEQWESKKSEAVRLQSHLRQSSQDINFIHGKNNQISQINDQLKEDLKVCQRHLQNLVRVNKSVECELEKMHQTNLNAIKKLQQPFGVVNNNWSLSKTGKWGASSRVTGSDSGDFDSVRDKKLVQKLD